MYNNYTAQNIEAFGNIINGANGRLFIVAGTAIVLGGLYCYYTSSEETKQEIAKQFGIIYDNPSSEYVKGPSSATIDLPIEDCNLTDTNTLESGESNG